MLELTTYFLQNSQDYQKDFSMIRVIEILNGNKNWDLNIVTLENFCIDKPLNRVLNSQMIIDVEVNKNHNGKNYITISRPDLQRILEGKPLGIAIKPLGAKDKIL